MSENRTNTRPTLPRGSVVGGYRVEMPLGSGGMSDVYYAIDLKLDRPVALKILRKVLAEDMTYQQRFQQEAKAAAALVHPNIVQVYNVGQDGDLRYISQEYVPGINLRSYLCSSTSLENDVLRAVGGPAAQAGTTGGSSGTSAVDSVATADRQLPIPEVISILLQVLAALSKSANVGIVHRDIKPENIMLTRDGEVKVTDFGLAFIQLGGDVQLTLPGTTMGTPMYMSPEQIQSGEVDIRSDLYSLGVTLFHMLYGRPPYAGDTALALAMQHVQGQLPDMSSLRPSVPESMVQLLRRLLAKAPEDRFSHPLDVLDYLHERRRGDLSACWPDRIVSMPSIVPSSGSFGEATQKLQALLSQPQQPKFLRKTIALTVAASALAALFWLGTLGHGLQRMGITWPPPEELLAITDAIYEGIPRQSDVREQYVWALLNQTSGRIAIWEAVGHYFPASDSQLNRLYGGLAKLQLARLYQEAGDREQAVKPLREINKDKQMLPMVQAYAWLELAAIDRSRGSREEMKAHVQQALNLRNGLNSKKDIDQLDHAVRAMPSDIELYWTPSPAR